MSSSRLYLIRVNYQRIIGPYNDSQLRAAHKAMKFGLRDEICGNLGHWVTFDDFDGIHSEYPELVRFVKQDMLAGWSPNPQAPSSQTGPRPETHQRRKFFLIVLALALIAWGLYFAKTHFGWDAQKSLGLIPPAPRCPSQLKGPCKPHFEEAMALYNKGSSQDVLSYIEFFQSQLTQKDTSKDWLPLLRYYAFNTQGKFTGLPDQRLRGRLPTPAPSSCATADLLTQLRGSATELASALNGATPSPTILRQSLLMILTWDPYWIRRRSPFKGWLEPTSYYQACIKMALKATMSPKSPANHVTAVIKKRLTWQLEAIAGRTEPQQPGEGPLEALSCMEAISKEAEIGHCTERMNFANIWHQFLERRRIDKLMWLAIQQADDRSSRYFARLKEGLSLYTLHDDLNRLVYREERFYFRAFIESNGDSRQAQQSVSQSYPNFNIE